MVRWLTCGEREAISRVAALICGLTVSIASTVSWGPPVRLHTCVAAGLDLATLPAQRALAGPGSFPNPDFLEVGYSPRSQKGRTQSLVEQRSMFTMWAALPGPLILSADLRTSSMNSGRGLDEDVLKILTNKVRAARCGARLACNPSFARYA
jgi:hypothetical protein